MWPKMDTVDDDCQIRTQVRIRKLTADPRQYMPADAVADLWSESAD